jgi:hypothetical protein
MKLKLSGEEDAEDAILPSFEAVGGFKSFRNG